MAKSTKNYQCLNIPYGLEMMIGNDRDLEVEILKEEKYE